MGELETVMTHDTKRIYPELTPRERVVAFALARGARMPSIARELGLSQKTVDTHRANALRKLGCTNNVELSLLTASRRSNLEPVEPSVSVSAETYATIAKAAEARGITPRELVERAVERGLVLAVDAPATLA